MCGIFGYSSQEPLKINALLDEIITRLQNRGPDDSGYWTQTGVLLAHTRLSIIDLEHGHQPLVDESQGLALVANGEIYNFKERREQLEREGYHFHTHSDSEVILRAYQAHGIDALPLLNGMFAFALYDTRNKRLILARDRLGMKPLYFLKQPGRFAFASEIKALRPLLDASPAMDEGAFIQYLHNQFSSGRQTILKDIQRVLPGECLIIDENLDIRFHRYWDATQIRPHKQSMDEAMEAFASLMDQVMEEHVRSDVPYGLFLSGGVDSGLMLAELKRHQDGPLRTYSVGYHNADMDDELSAAARLARHFGTQHTEVRIDSEDLFHRIPFMTWATDELMRDYACIPTSFLAEAAGRDLKVVFTGEGGDEAFAGYGRYRESWPLRALKAFRSPGTGGFRSRGQWRHAPPQQVFSKALLNAHGARLQQIRAARARAPRDWDEITIRQYTDLVTALPDNLLTKVDRNLMAFSLEGRTPLLDHRIVEFGLSLPADLKISGGQGKRFLKRWAERDLPADLLYRPKKGFHVPVKSWLKGEFLEQLAQRLPENTGIRAWFTQDGVLDTLKRQKTHGDASREVFSLLQFAIWHKLFIEGDGSAPPMKADPLEWI